MLWKCFTQNASKFGKLSNGHKTGNGQFLFQSQRRAMSKKAQTTSKLHSSHRLVKQCSKFSSQASMVNFQMSKLVLERAEEPEIKLPTSVGSLEKQESSRKISTSALLIMPKPLTVWITQQVEENCSRDGNARPPDLPPEKSVCRSRSNS